MVDVVEGMEVPLDGVDEGKVLEAEGEVLLKREAPLCAIIIILTLEADVVEALVSPKVALARHVLGIEILSTSRVGQFERPKKSSHEVQYMHRMVETSF